MSANVEAMIREGISAVKAGNKEEGRALLMKAVELDPYNEEGWLWLSGVVESPEDQRTCLENVLSINPNNDRARQGIAYITGQNDPEPPSSPAPISTASASRAPTSVEWDMPATETSSPSTAYRPNEPTADEYDDWVSGLNLATTDPGSSSPFSVPAFSTGSPFLGSDDDDEDADLFTSGPFSSAPIVEDAPSTPAAAAPSFSFQKAPTFSAPAKSPTPTSPVPEVSAPVKEKEKGRGWGRGRGKEKEKPKAKADSRKAASADAFPEEMEVDAFFKDLGMKEDVKTPNAPVVEEEESELFGYIPKEIKPTRLPGTRERTPILLVVAALLLAVLNIGVATLLVIKFLTPV